MTTDHDRARRIACAAALLLNLSEAALLDNLFQRLKLGEPYTYTGGILTSVNPCRATTLYTADVMTSYAGRLMGGNRPPHLYAMAEEAYRLLIRTRAHQGMVVSGVSGAGKTEANKIIMQYLCWRASHSAGQIGRNMVLLPSALAAADQLAQGGLSGLDELPRKILNSNVIFEAIGNGEAAPLARHGTHRRSPTAARPSHRPPLVSAACPPLARSTPAAYPPPARRTARHPPAACARPPLPPPPAPP